MGHFKQSVQWAGRRLHLIWERLELKSPRNKSRRHQALPHPAASNSAEGFRTGRSLVVLRRRLPGHCDGDGLLCQWLPEGQALHGSCLGWGRWASENQGLCSIDLEVNSYPPHTSSPGAACLIRVQFLILTPIHLFLGVKGPAKQFLCTRFLSWYCTCLCFTRALCPEQ